MKVAILSTGPGLDSQVSPVFGQAPYIVVAEVVNGEIVNVQSIPNQMVGPGGRGVAMAQQIASLGAQAVVAGSFGPNASAMLQQMGIKMYIAPGLTVRDAALKVERGELQEFIPTVAPGYGPGFGPGMGRGMGRGRGFKGRGWL